jgi:tetratricopeptide (TPR) repeat protein
MSSLFLVVDEHPVFLAQIAGALGAAGYVPLTAGTAAEGLKLLGGLPPEMALGSASAQEELRAGLPEGIPVYFLSPGFKALAGKGAQSVAAYVDPILAQDHEPPALEGTTAGAALPDLLLTIFRQRLTGVLQLQWSAGSGAHGWTIEFARGEVTSLSHFRDSAQMETMIRQVTGAADGKYSFTLDHGAAAIPTMPLIPLAVQLLRQLDEARLTALFEGARWVPVPHPLPLRPLEQLPLTPAEGYLFSQVDGRRTLDEIAAAGVVGRKDCLRAMLTLLALRLVSGRIEGHEFIYGKYDEFMLAKTILLRGSHSAAERIEALAARLRSRLPDAILGLGTQAPDEERRARCELLVAEFQPAKFSPEIRERYRNKLALIHAALGEVQLGLHLPGGAAASGAVPQNTEEFRREEAAQLRDKAAACLKAEQYDEAHKLLQLSLHYDPERAETHHMLGVVMLKNPNSIWQRQAEESLLKALALDPGNADYSVTLAHYYLERSMPLKARRALEPALKKNPSHTGVILAAEEIKRKSG